MTETQTQVDLPARVRDDQKAFLNHIAKTLGVPVSVVVRWALDDARPFLLARACLKENDLPEDIRRTA